jgi:hypothetical protein
MLADLAVDHCSGWGDGQSFQSRREFVSDEIEGGNSLSQR